MEDEQASAKNRTVTRRELLRRVALTSAGLAGLSALMGCQPAAPAAQPQPTVPAPTAATAATAVPAKPTAASAKKVDWPDKTKTLTFINPATAGGDYDVQIRILMPYLQKELGINIETISKTGAGNQVGLTELARSKPDGYTVGMTGIPSAVTIYMDPNRQAVFNRKSFIPLGMHSFEPGATIVPANSPFKTMKDLVEAARAKPESVKVADAGILNAGHLAILQLQEAAKVKFAVVHFNGGADIISNILGGHVDAGFTFVPIVVPPFKQNQLRVLSVADSQPSKHLPGVPSIEQAGYKANPITSSVRFYSAPAGTPQEIVNILVAAMKTAMLNPEHIAKMEELFFTPRYMTPEQIEPIWAQMEVDVQPLMKLAQ